MVKHIPTGQVCWTESSAHIHVHVCMYVCMYVTGIVCMPQRCVISNAYGRSALVKNNALICMTYCSMCFVITAILYMYVGKRDHSSSVH